MDKLFQVTPNINIRRIAVVFVILGIIGFYYIYDSTTGFRYYTSSGDSKYISLPGAVPFTKLIPLETYNTLIIIVGILSSLYIIEGILMFVKTNKFTYWTGIILTVILFLNFPIGTILALIIGNVILKNKSVFYSVQKS